MQFNIGDYIGDENDTCWKVESVTEKEYGIVYIPDNTHKVITREEKPHIWSHDKDYAVDYHILREHDHPDITEYPIGSMWKFNEESGLNDPEKDTVMIVDYALSKGVFWVCNVKMKSILIIARKEKLQPIQTDNAADH